MDLPSALKNEIFRPLTTIVVPGAVALGPFILLLEHYVPPVKTFSDADHSWFGFALLVGILAAGFLLEDLGSRIETLWDACLIHKQPNRKQIWVDYLQLKIDGEIIGQRYLRTMLVRFKFELSMAPALVVFTIGLLWLNGVHAFWHASAMAWVTVLLLSLIVLLLKESYDSADRLGKLRESIIATVNASSKS